MKILILVEIILFAAFLGLFYWHTNNYDLNTVYVPPKPLELKTNDSRAIPACIFAINRKNDALKSFSSDVDIEIYERFIHKATAKLYYQKNKKFRMITHSILGLESDVGSNDDYFWFWSKRMKPSVLYFAQHKNLFSTGLKTPFNPCWMMQSLGIDVIKTENVLIQEIEEKVIIKQMDLSPIGESICKIILIEDGRIVGYYLYREEKLIASTEIISFVEDLPKTIQIIWHEENMRMIWNLKNQKVNIGIPEHFWQKPEKNSIELGL